MVKNRSKRKRNFTIYHLYLVKSKPHERIDLLITTGVNIYQTKKSNGNENWWSNLETPFCLRGPPVSTNTPISSEQIFMTTLFVKFKKTTNPPPPPPPNFRGEETMRTPPNCTILDNWLFENSALDDTLFGKAFRIFETCVSVNNNFCEKLVSSLEFPVKFDGRLKVTSVHFLF